MKTKIVYVVISDEQDVYFEQAWVSAFSARYYNPDVKIFFVTDEETKENILCTKRKQVMSVIDGIISVEFEPDCNKMKRSRWIKVNIRNLVEGDILFVDTDTIVAGCLSEVDDFDMCIGAVYDAHCKIKYIPYLLNIKKVQKKIFDRKEFCNDVEYFNSGVLYIKDNEITRKFFLRWHQYWEYGVKKGILTDQQSLYETVNDFPEVIKPIDGIYNCQVSISVQYLNSAKIVHFYNSKYSRDYINPFFGKEIYLLLKECGFINPEMKDKILRCKDLFPSPSKIICADDYLIYTSSIFGLLHGLYKYCRGMYSLINYVSSGIVRLYLFIKRS